MINKLKLRHFNYDNRGNRLTSINKIDIMLLMSTKHKRLLFYMGLYLITIAIALIGLSINIRTVSINEKTLKLNTKINKIEEKNNELYLKLLASTTLEKIERIATQDLKMIPMKKIIYLKAENGPE